MDLCCGGMRSSEKHTPVALARGAAARELARLGGSGDAFLGSEIKVKILKQLNMADVLFSVGNKHEISFNNSLFHDF